MVDHANGNGLDNRRCNIRLCTPQQNACNGKLFPAGVKIRGARYVERLGKYAVAIGINRKHIYLGLYSDPMEAALAYNDAAKKYHGEFATLNDVEYLKLHGAI